MSDAKQPSTKADQLAGQLKDSLARRRPRPWKLVLVMLFGSVVFLGLLAWWLYPRPRLAPLQIIALDVLATPDETPHALAQLLAPPDDPAPRRLSRHTVIFHEQRLVLKPAEKPRIIEAKSDDHGQASVEWPTAQPGLTEYLVLYKDEEQGRGSPHELGRIFLWPKDAPLLVVDADETLIGDELDVKASETLTKAAKEGWRVVYLATASTKAHEFRSARGWISKHQAKLPVGPVLSRRHFTDEATPAEARREVLKALRDRFTGPILVVVKSAESADACKDVGIRAILIGDTKTPTWADVPGKLK